MPVMGSVVRSSIGHGVSAGLLGEGLASFETLQILNLDLPFLRHLAAKTAFMSHISPTEDLATLCEGIKGGVVGNDACYISNCSGVCRNI
jgi:hypothetical protein